MLENFEYLADNAMSKLNDLYQMKDWGLTWIEFTEKFTEVMLTTIGEWQISHEEE